MGQKSTTDGSKTTFKKGSSEAGWAKNQQPMGQKSTTDGSNKTPYKITRF
jgi:hypothetical protein